MFLNTPASAWTSIYRLTQSEWAKLSRCCVVPLLYPLHAALGQRPPGPCSTCRLAPVRHHSWLSSLPWSSRDKSLHEHHKAPPDYPVRPEAWVIGSFVWNDPYSWLGKQGHEAEGQQLLQQERRHYEHFASGWARLKRQLLSEMREHLEDVDSQTGPAPPERCGEYFYYSGPLSTGGQPSLLRCHASTGRQETLLSQAILEADAQLLSDHLGFQIAGSDARTIKISQDQRLLAYTLPWDDSKDACCGCVRDLEAGALLEGSILPHVDGIEWSADGRWLFYTVPDQSGRPSKVMRRRLGAAVPEDALVFEEHDPAHFVSLTRTKDWKYVLINSHAKLSSEVHLVDAAQPEAPPMCIIPRQRGHEYFLEHWHDRLLLLTNFPGRGDYQLMALTLGQQGAARQDEGQEQQHEQQEQQERRGLHLGHQWEQITANAYQLHQQQRQQDGVPGGSALGSSWDVLVPERPMSCTTDLDVFERACVLHEMNAGRPGLSLVRRGAPGGRRGRADAGTVEGGGGHSTGGGIEVSAQQALLPPWALAMSPGANQDYRSPVFRLTLSSPVHPPVVYDMSLDDGKLTLLQGRGYDMDSPGNSNSSGLTSGSSSLASSSSSLANSSSSLYSGTNDLTNRSSGLTSGSSLPSSSGDLTSSSSSSGGLTSGNSSLSSSMFQHEGYACTRAWVPSHDGVPVPLTFMHRVGLSWDGNSPVFVQVYGAYGAVLEADYDPTRRVLMDRGWVVALAHVRGGGELGRRWHASGRQLQKPNSHLDLLACLRWLVRHGVTSPGRIAAHASSAGCLALGAALNVDASLFGAVMLEAPFVDLLGSMGQTARGGGRIRLAGVGVDQRDAEGQEAAEWQGQLIRHGHMLTEHERDEWGDATNSSKVLSVLRALCPYTNVGVAGGEAGAKDGDCYPPVLITIGLADERVPWSGALKYAAKLRAANAAIAASAAAATGGGANAADARRGQRLGRWEGGQALQHGDVLLRVEEDGGHFGMGLCSREAGEIADVYSFAMAALQGAQEAAR